VVRRLWGSLLEVSGPVGGEGVGQGMVLFVEEGWMVERNWVMAGRPTSSEGGQSRWIRLSICGEYTGKRDVTCATRCRTCKRAGAVAIHC